MKSKFIQLASGLVAGMACVVSCVEINEELGKEYIPTKHMYDVYTDTVFFKDIEMRNADRLSGYSSSRITIGAVRDDEFGLTTRGSAFTLIPVDEIFTGVTQDIDPRQFSTDGVHPTHRGCRYIADLLIKELKKCLQ